MPNVTTQPVTPVQTGQADVLLTQTDMLRNNPQILDTFFKTYGGYKTFAQKLRALGFAKAVQGPITEHYEEPRERRTFTVGSIVTASTGVNGQIVIALSAADMQALVDDTGTTRYYSRPRATETVQFADKKNYKITAKDQTTNPAVHRLTLKPMDASVNPGTAIIAGAKAFIIAPIKAEATGQVKSLTNLYFKYQNRFAIVDETALASGTALTTRSPLNSPVVQIPGAPRYWYIKDIQDAEIRHEVNKSLAIVHGQLGNSNITQYSPDFEQNMPVRDTEGLIQYALTAGYDKQFASLDVYSEDDMYEIMAYYKSKMVATDSLIAWQGYSMNTKLEKLFRVLLSDTFVNYVSTSFMKDALSSYTGAGMNANDMFISFGFYGIRLGSYNLLFAPLEELNDAEGGGIFDYPQWQIITPLARTRDAKTKALLPYMGYEYRGQDAGGYSRENEAWKTGGAGPIQKTDEFDVHRSFLRSEVALHCANGELIVVNRPVPA